MQRTISVFLASSSELYEERLAFSKMIEKLQRCVEKRSITISLYKWENESLSMTPEGMQEYYNQLVRKSDIFVALFWKRYGKETVGELDVAYEEMCRGRLPKVIYPFFKTTALTEIDPELQSFKDNFEYKYKRNYYKSFSNIEDVIATFLLEFINFLSRDGVSSSAQLNEGRIEFEGIPFADFTKVSYVSKNRDYDSLKREYEDALENLKSAYNSNPAEIVAASKRLTEANSALIDCQKSIFDTAAKIARIDMLEHNKIIEEAIKAFENGDSHKACQIMNSRGAIEERTLRRQKYQIDRAALETDLKECLLSAGFIMSDFTLPISQRISDADSLYREAEQIAGIVYSGHSYEYFDTILQIATFFQQIDKIDEAIHYYSLALSSLSPNDGQESRILGLRYNIASLLLRTSNAEEADRIYSEITFALVGKGKIKYNEMHLLIASLYGRSIILEKKDIQEAEKVLDNVLELLQSMGDIPGEDVVLIGSTLLRKADMSIRQCKWNDADYYISQGFSLAESINQFNLEDARSLYIKCLESSIYLNYITHHWDKVEEMARVVASYYNDTYLEKGEGLLHLVESLIHLGRAQNAQSKAEEALDSFHEAHTLISPYYQAYGNDMEIVRVYASLLSEVASCYLSNGDKDKAIELMEQSICVLQKTASASYKDLNFLALEQLNVARYQLPLKDDLNRAIELTSEAINNARKLVDSGFQEALGTLINAYVYLAGYQHFAQDDEGCKLSLTTAISMVEDSEIEGSSSQFASISDCGERIIRTAISLEDIKLSYSFGQFCIDTYKKFKEPLIRPAVASIASILGFIFEHVNEYKIAEEYTFLAVDLYTELANEYPGGYQAELKDENDKLERIRLAMR